MFLVLILTVHYTEGQVDLKILYMNTCRIRLKKFLICKKKHTPYTSVPCKNFFSNTIVNIFTFTSSMVSMITIILVIYLYCKHKHIRTIIASLILHKVIGVEANTPTKQENTECQTLAYIGITLTLLSMMIVVFLHYRRLKFCRGTDSQTL